FGLDLLVHDSPPLPLRCARCASSLSKAFFKKSFSIVSRPIARSSSASRLLGLISRCPLKALPGSFSHSLCHRYSIEGSISLARATSANVLPLSNCRTALILNSLLNLRRDMIIALSSYCKRLLNQMSQIWGAVQLIANCYLLIALFR